MSAKQLSGIQLDLSCATIHELCSGVARCRITNCIYWIKATTSVAGSTWIVKTTRMRWKSRPNIWTVTPWNYGTARAW